MPSLTCGTLLAHLLEAYGTEHVFGIPGVHNVEVYRGLWQTKIRHISPRHEQGAGFMADGYARATGKPGVAFVITGPGLTNIATAMGQAYADSVPMLVIAAVNRRHQLGFGRGFLHEMPNQRNLAAGLTAFAHTLQRAEDLPDVLAAAFSVFSSSRPRPVVIEVPIDVLEQRLEAEVPTAAELFHLPAPGPDPEAIARAAAILGAAKRVVLIAGGGAQGAGAEITGLAEKLGAVVQLTTNGRGLLSPDHPALADFGITKEAGCAIMDKADAVVAIGTEIGETDFGFYATKPFAVATKFIRIDIDPRQIAIGPKPTVGIVSDARLALRAIDAALKPGKPDEAWAKATTERLSRIAATIREPEDPLYDKLLTTIRDACGDPILVGDSTKAVYRGGLTYRAPKPRSFFSASTGFGTLGYALPAAIGAKIAMPDRPVLALAGDGGAQFTLPELISAREAEAGIVLLIWNNNGYREIRDYMVSKEIKPIAVDPCPPDFIKSAEAMGVPGRRIDSLDDLAAALRAHGSSAKVPLLLEAGPGIKG